MIIQIKDEKKVLTNPKDVAEILWSILRMESEVDKDKEHFWVIGLDTRNAIKYIDLVSLGTLNASLVHPRETFRLAVMKAVAQIIIGHNHPSGDPEPSEDDLAITKRLEMAGKIMGINIVDHIIITRNAWFSFKDKRLIDEKK
jgi:DNA repair protein RadC